MKTPVLCLTAASVLCLLSHSVRGQGDLEPSGAPKPTMKTLEQVEARTDVAMLAGDASGEHVISSPGSYYLSGNVSLCRTAIRTVSTARTAPRSVTAAPTITRAEGLK